MYRKLVSGVAMLMAAMMLVSTPAFAAKKKVVLQISDGSPQKQTLVLNVANNVIKHYGMDEVSVEVVAFGPGLRLLFRDNVNKDRVQSLNATGVRFSACKNTIKGMSKKLGHAPKLSAQAVPVSAGVARILELTEQGYTLIRP